MQSDLMSGAALVVLRCNSVILGLSRPKQSVFIVVHGEAHLSVCALVSMPPMHSRVFSCLPSRAFSSFV